MISFYAKFRSINITNDQLVICISFHRGRHNKNDSSVYINSCQLEGEETGETYKPTKAIAGKRNITSFYSASQNVPKMGSLLYKFYFQKPKVNEKMTLTVTFKSKGILKAYINPSPPLF